MGFAFEYVLLVGVALRSLSLVGAPRPAWGRRCLAPLIVSSARAKIQSTVNPSPRVINYLKKHIE